MLAGIEPRNILKLNLLARRLDSRGGRCGSPATAWARCHPGRRSLTRPGHCKRTISRDLKNRPQIIWRLEGKNQEDIDPQMYPLMDSETFYCHSSLSLICMKSTNWMFHIYTDNRIQKINPYIRKFRRDWCIGLPNIWGNRQIFSHIWGRH